MKYWDTDEIIGGLDYFRGSPIYFHVFTALNPRLRQGEICAFTIDYIDFEKGVIKANKIRIHDMRH